MTKAQEQSWLNHEYTRARCEEMMAVATAIKKVRDRLVVARPPATSQTNTHFMLLFVRSTGGTAPSSIQPPMNGDLLVLMCVLLCVCVSLSFLFYFLCITSCLCLGATMAQKTACVLLLVFLVGCCAAAGGGDVGILYEVWHTPAAQAMQKVSCGQMNHKD